MHRILRPFSDAADMSTGAEFHVLMAKRCDLAIAEARLDSDAAAASGPVFRSMW